jgi:hypothetical protein
MERTLNDLCSWYPPPYFINNQTNWGVKFHLFQDLAFRFNIQLGRIYVTHQTVHRVCTALIVINGSDIIFLFFNLRRGSACEPNPCTCIQH